MTQFRILGSKLVSKALIVDVEVQSVDIEGNVVLKHLSSNTTWDTSIKEVKVWRTDNVAIDLSKIKKPDAPAWNHLAGIDDATKNGAFKEAQFDVEGYVKDIFTTVVASKK